MPRKQRFKPSRKPKPSPQSEAATIGHDGRNPSSLGGSHDNPSEPTGSSQMNDEDSGLKPDPSR
jgi:hypothetical protein